MLFQIDPVRPNPREPFQQQVRTLCQKLKDENGRKYRASVFKLLTITGNQFLKRGYGRFREHPESKLFLKQFGLDVRGLEIMNELDNIYNNSKEIIDDLRGAVGEVFCLFISRKKYSNAEIEICVKCDSWTSGTIDVAGCDHETGCCLQSKCSTLDVSSIVNQHNQLKRIERYTKGKAKGAFFTYLGMGKFESNLLSRGIRLSDLVVFDRTNMAVLEERLAS